MDDYFKNLFSIRVAMTVCMFLIVSLYQSCTELNDSLHGIIAQGTIVKCTAMNDRRGRASGWDLTVLVDRPNERPLRLMLSAGRRFGPFKDGDSVEVIYRPNAPEMARLTAQRSIVWPLILGGLILAFAIWCVGAYQRAQAGKF